MAGCHRRVRDHRVHRVPRDVDRHGSPGGVTPALRRDPHRGDARPGRRLPRVVRDRARGSGDAQPGLGGRGRARRGQPHGARIAPAPARRAPPGWLTRPCPGVGGGRLRHGRGDPVGDPPRAGCVAGPRRGRTDRVDVGGARCGGARDRRSAGRDRGPSPRVPRVPGTSVEDQARGRAARLRDPGAGVPRDGNLLAPVIAHIVLHGQMVLGGIEMPPSERVRLMPVGSGVPQPASRRTSDAVR